MMATHPAHRPDPLHPDPPHPDSPRPDSPRADSPPTATPGAGRADDLARLKARIRRLEGTDLRVRTALPLGLAAVDRVLPGGGLAGAALHEVVAASDDPAAVGFVAWCLARAAAARRRPVLWVAGGEGPYPPGLQPFGLTAERLVLVAARHPADRLWVMEEAARNAGDGRVLAAVAGTVAALAAVAGRRLHLAAEAGGIPLLVLRTDARAAAGAGSVAVTRWRVASRPGVPCRLCDGAPEPGVPPARWRLDLVRCRGGRPAGWAVDWRGPDVGRAEAGFAEAVPVPEDAAPPSPSPVAAGRDMVSA